MRHFRFSRSWNVHVNPEKEVDEKEIHLADDMEMNPNLSGHNCMALSRLVHWLVDWLFGWLVGDYVSAVLTIVSYIAPLG